jgi:galactose mutarotase-like enzyme
VSLEIDPQRGGVVTSLRNKAFLEDWIAKAEAEPKTKTGSFSDTGFGGWYEMLPSIIGDLSPDHGEVWQIPWDVIEMDALGVSLHVTSPSSGVTFCRSIRLDPVRPEISVVYSLQNPNDAPYRFLWACHPLFALYEDTRLHVNGVESWLQVDPGHQEVSNLPKSNYLGVPAGSGAKWWSQKAERFESVSLKSESQGTLIIRPSLNLDHLGIWVDNQKHSKSPSIALEPAIGWYDDLAIAMENGTAGEVSSKGSATWSLLLSLS